jgi:hypothetical protein
MDCRERPGGPPIFNSERIEKPEGQEKEIPDASWIFSGVYDTLKNRWCSAQKG